MHIRQIQEKDYNNWLQMRIKAWPDKSPVNLMYEMSDIYRQAVSGIKGNWMVFVCESVDSRLIGFVEVSIQHKSTGLMKGLYLDPSFMGDGFAEIGSMLVKKAEEWTISRGCIEMISTTSSIRTRYLLPHFESRYMSISNHTNEFIFKKLLSTSGNSIINRYNHNSGKENQYD